MAIFKTSIKKVSENTSDYLLELLLESEGYDAIDRKTLKRHLRTLQDNK